MKKLSAKQVQYNIDTNLWETNRLKTSGMGRDSELEVDLDESSELRVHLLVHDIKPPFLDGRQVYTRQLENIQSVRDPTSDLAIFSRKGSRLVREKREQSERMKKCRKV